MARKKKEETGAKKEIVEWPIDRLTPHPLQHQLKGKRPEWQLRELADDMAKNGQVEDVEVLPDATIISGHGRVEAGKLLGWKTVRCWVRHDLAAAGPQAVEARLVWANLGRQQLSKLDMVRQYAAHQAYEKEWLHGQPPPSEGRPARPHRRTLWREGQDPRSLAPDPPTADAVAAGRRGQQGAAHPRGEGRRTAGKDEDADRRGNCPREVRPGRRTRTRAIHGGQTGDGARPSQRPAAESGTGAGRAESPNH